MVACIVPLSLPECGFHHLFLIGNAFFTISALCFLSVYLLNTDMIIRKKPVCGHMNFIVPVLSISDTQMQDFPRTAGQGKSGKDFRLLQNAQTFHISSPVKLKFLLPLRSPTADPAVFVSRNKPPLQYPLFPGGKIRRLIHIIENLSFHIPRHHAEKNAFIQRPLFNLDALCLHFFLFHPSVLLNQKNKLFFQKRQDNFY